VGSITCQGMALSSLIMTSSGPQASGDATTDHGSHLAATAVLDSSVEVERRLQGPDGTEPSVFSPIAVRRLFNFCLTIPHQTFGCVDYVGVFH